MFGTAHHPVTSIASRARLCVGSAIAVLLMMLLLVATANAEPVSESGGLGSETVPISETAPEAGSPGGQPEEATPPVEEPTPVSEPAPVTEPAPVAESPPVTEPAPEVPPPASAPEPTTPTPEPAPEVAAPVTPPPVTEVSSPVSPIVVEQTKESALLTPAGGEAPSSPDAQQQPPAPAPSPSPPVTPEVAAQPLVPPATIATTGEPEAPLESSTKRSSATVAHVSLTPAQRAVDLSCQLSGLSGQAAENCTSTWSRSASFATASAVFASEAPSPGTGVSQDGGLGGSSGGSRSVAPPPGPAPSGAGGGSAAGGAGGAFSGFFTLSGLLLHAAPRAMRRLRLSCRPWLTAFFVLIPERPG